MLKLAIVIGSTRPRSVGEAITWWIYEFFYSEWNNLAPYLSATAAREEIARWSTCGR